ncbi:MAG: hybrid sensor histidine kinase/response regulator [Myxococcales bacterium]|nr:hybrid sensor histidine kinase/response regulator [Myxococcales bacterium]
MAVEEAPAILVVDDHLPNLLAIEAVLGGMGYPLAMVQSAEEALGRPISEQVGLILMDVHMPLLDGYETTALLRRERPQLKEVPVVFLTAVSSTAEDMHRGYALGAVDYIVKPFDPVVLRSKVQALVGLYLRGRNEERARSERTHRVKDMFLGAIGHDLRNPLNALFVACKLIGAVPCSQPTHAEIARRIGRSADRMNSIVEDILDLTRDEFTGGIPLSLSETDLAALCQRVVDELRAAHPDRIFLLDIEGRVVGKWDGPRLARVLSNLLGNAAQHSNGGPIRVGVADRGALVRLTVHNGGDPIPSDALPFVFEPFRSGDVSSQGLGLGLFIVRTIVRAHGGQIAVTSTASAGTRFTVYLPKQPIDGKVDGTVALSDELPAADPADAPDLDRRGAGDATQRGG